MRDEIKLIENFTSFQGEGPDSGRRMIILRFKSCNKRCPWCDTAVKMRVSAEGNYTIEEIQDQIYKDQAGIMVTGGEPTVERHFNEAVRLLTTLTYPIANVESNGYKLSELIGAVNALQPNKPIRYIFSPKIFNDTDYDIALEFVHRVLINNDKVIMKIVYEDRPIINDFLNEINGLFSLQSRSQFMNSEKVWIMPEGATREKLIENAPKVFDICEKYNFNFSSRTHILYGFI
jgi:organic radical activating enzyme